MKFFVWSFEVCCSFVGFVYVYCLVQQGIVVFCFVFRRRSAAKFFVFVTFSNIKSSFCSVEEVLFSFFVSVNFSNV